MASRKGTPQQEGTPTAPAMKTMELDTDVPLTCPSCGAVLCFSPTTHNLFCASCGGHQPVGSGAGAAWKPVKEPVESSSAEDDRPWGKRQVEVSCRSCGAQATLDANLLAQTCPYCGNSEIEVFGSDALDAPSGIIPFSITKQTAAQNFRMWLGKRPFAPGAVRRNTRPDAFLGIYLPGRTFDASTDASFSAEYSTTRTVEHRDADGNVQTEDITEQHPYDGHLSRDFENLFTYATDRYDSKSLGRIEPFDLGDACEYAPGYLAGFSAERYSVGVRSCSDTVSGHIRDSLYSDARDIVASAHPENTGVDITSLRFDFRSFVYASLLLPVWTSSFDYNGTSYRFLVNGQTGKVYGETPLSAWKVAALIAAIVAVIVFIIYLIVGR